MQKRRKTIAFRRIRNGTIICAGYWKESEYEFAPHETQVLQWAYSALRMSEHKFWDAGDGDSALDCHNSADMLQQTFDKFCAWIEDDYSTYYENEQPDKNH